jgi:octaprenyl-diphosphate synthase
MEKSDMPKDKLHRIFKSVSSDLEKIESLIKKTRLGVQTPLHVMLKFSLGGGKRLRPALVVLTGSLLKVQKQKIYALAAAVEVLHSATLIHDDLVDDSFLRRGHKTLNAVWPPGATVLAGDFLLARSVSLIAELENPALLGVLAEALYTMSAGEINYHYSRQSKKDRSVYFSSIEAKTASLFSAAARMVGMLAGRKEREIDSLDVFGREFGIAYQIVDDVLDFIGTEKQLGKPAGSDLIAGTITLPAICYLERIPEDRSIDRIASGKAGHKELNAFIMKVRESGAIEDALDEARAHARKSKTALAKVPAERSKRTLFDLIDYIVERTH